jgi:hypothetical protein
LPIVFIFLFLVAAAPRAGAGDYYTYRDAKGNLVLSNQTPPPGRAVINKQTLPEVSDQELAAARDLENAAYERRISSLEASVDELQYNTTSERPAARYVEPENYVGGDVAVGVGGPVIITRPLRPVRPPLNSKNDSTNRPPRSGGAWPQSPRQVAPTG